VDVVVIVDVEQDPLGLGLGLGDGVGNRSSRQTNERQRLVSLWRAAFKLN